MEIRVRRDGAIRLPDEVMDALNINPGGKIRVTVEGARIMLEKVALPDDPFAAAAKGPDLSALDRIREKQKQDAKSARDRFEELMKDPPEIRPEDNPDLWR